MAYTAPTQKELLNGCDVLLLNYKNNNAARKQLISDLQATELCLSRLLIAGQTQWSEDELNDISLGAWVFLLASISCEYKNNFRPERSSLYKLAKFVLKIRPTETVEQCISYERQWILIEKYYEFAFQTHPNRSVTLSPLKDYFTTSQFTHIKKQMISVMKELVKKLDCKIESFLHALPTEEAFDRDNCHFYSSYKAKKDKAHKSYFSLIDANNGRYFEAQLLEAVTNLASTFVEDKGEPPAGMLTFTHMLKLGAVLYVLKPIASEYTIRSPSNSILYDMCKPYLGDINIKDIDPGSALSWLVVFRNTINKGNYLATLESYGNKEFDINLLKRNARKLTQIPDELDKLIDTYARQRISPSYFGTNLFGNVGAFFLGSYAYGIGNVLGNYLAETQFLTAAKLFQTKLYNKIGIAFLGKVGGYLGVLLADEITQSALERAFGKVLEEIAKLIGFASAGAVGFIVFDLSYNGLIYLCNSYFAIRSNIKDPAILQSTDTAFIQCILNCPQEVISDADKSTLERIAYGITGLRLFSPSTGPGSPRLRLREGVSSEGSERQKALP